VIEQEPTPLCWQLGRRLAGVVQASLTDGWQSDGGDKGEGSQDADKVVVKQATAIIGRCTEAPKPSTNALHFAGRGTVACNETQSFLGGVWQMRGDLGDLTQIPAENALF
jgi:hypothetical protein